VVFWAFFFCFVECIVVPHSRSIPQGTMPLCALVVAICVSPLPPVPLPHMFSASSNLPRSTLFQKSVSHADPLNFLFVPLHYCVPVGVARPPGFPFE